MTIYLLLAIAVFFGGLAAYIAEEKGRSHGEGFILGFFFGIFGLLLFFPEKPKK